MRIDTWLALHDLPELVDVFFLLLHDDLELDNLIYALTSSVLAMSLRCRFLILAVIS